MTDDNKQFWVNSTSGAIHRTPGALLTPGDMISLNVKVRDSGTPSRTSSESALVRVRLLTFQNF